jgi:hypothetical protein
MKNLAKCTLHPDKKTKPYEVQKQSQKKMPIPCWVEKSMNPTNTKSPKSYLIQ